MKYRHTYISTEAAMALRVDQVDYLTNTYTVTQCYGLVKRFKGSLNANALTTTGVGFGKEQSWRETRS